MMKPLLLLALAYSVPALLLLLFAQGWTWLYVFPLALIVTSGLVAGKNGATRPPN
jgi:hypothetical protein